jgi:hypothetical protein
MDLYSLSNLSNLDKHEGIITIRITDTSSFIYDLCNVVTLPNYLLFSHNINIFRAIKFPQNYSLDLMDSDSIRGT